MSLITELNVQQTILSNKRKRADENADNCCARTRQKTESLHDVIRRGHSLSYFQFILKQVQDLNIKELGVTPLELSLSLSKTKIAISLLKAGASRSAVITTDDSSMPARAYCDWMCLRDALSYFPKEPISDELIFRLSLGHIFSIKGITSLGPYWCNLEGGYEDFLFQFWLNLLEN